MKLMNATKSVKPLKYSDMLIPVADLWPVSVERYHAMIEAGLLTPDDKIELLEGQLIQQMSKNPPHSHANRVLYRLLLLLLLDKFLVSAQEPITTIDSEPEPDLALVRGGEADYDQRHPHPNEIPLVIEIANTSLSRDRTQKLRIYAHAGIEQYWIVNLIDQQVEVYTRPQGSEYAQKQTYSQSEPLPVTIDGENFGTLSIAEFLPS